MTVRKLKSAARRIEALVAEDRDPPKSLVMEALEEVLQAGMTDCVGAESRERTAGRVGYRAGYYDRGLIMRVGEIELRVPRDRAGELSTALFARFGRSERALVSAFAKMYVQGVSTRKVKSITEEFCGHRFSASAISAINKGLNESLTRFAQRRLTEAYPYLILDARYEKVREVVYDPEIRLSSLLGANRRFIKQHVPHIGSLVRSDIAEVIAGSDVLFIGLGDAQVAAALVMQVRPDQIIVDLVSLAARAGLLGAYGCASAHHCVVSIQSFHRAMS